MPDTSQFVAKLSGQTKALMIANEFFRGSMSLPQLKDLLDAMAASDLERIGLIELIRQECEAIGVPPDRAELLLSGLRGMPSSPGQISTPTLPAQQRPTSVVTPEKAAPSEAASVKAHTPPATPMPTTKPMFERRNESFFGSASTAQSGGYSTRKRGKILVADDDPRSRLLYRAALEKADYAVTEAQNGDQAWQLLDEIKPDVFITDMKMPGMHGLEILAKLTSEGRVLPTIVCSAYDQLKNEFVVTTYPNLKYLVKPVKIDDLLAAVHELITGRNR